jgi:hypothetical protein
MKINEAKHHSQIGSFRDLMPGWNFLLGLSRRKYL